MELELEVKGLTPLLQNNAAPMLTAKKGKTTAEKDPSPEYQASQGIYLNDDDQFCHPTVAFRSAILGGGKEVKIGRSAASKYIAGALLLNPQPDVVLLTTEGEPFAEYDLHVASVVMPSTKGRVVRGWPKFKNWQVHLSAYIDEEMWPADMETLERVFKYAGTLYGVGDGRPEKRKLGFGQFEVKVL